jgi:hypothetical protein
MRRSDRELIAKKFEFLSSEYGMQMDLSDTGELQSQDGVMRFVSSVCEVNLRLEGGLLYLTLRPATEPKEAEVSLDDIAQFATKGEIDRIVNSLASNSATADRIAYEADAQARALRAYGATLLDGSCSDWLAISEHKLERLRQHYYSLTGRELPDESLSAYVRTKRQGLN